MPGLPNHFMIFGPYGWTGASWHVLVQTASRHIIRVIEEATRRGADRGRGDRGGGGGARSFPLEDYRYTGPRLPVAQRKARREGSSAGLTSHVMRPPTVA